MNKKAKILLISSVLSLLILIGAGIGAYFVLKKNSPPKGLYYDYPTASIVKSRLEKLQIVPNAEILATPEISPSSLSSSSLTSHTMNIDFSVQDYTEISNEYSQVKLTTGQNTSLSELKKEFLSVLQLSPTFNAWFVFSGTKQFNESSYNLTYDPSTEKISITKLSFPTTCGVFNLDKNQVYTSESDSSIQQYQIIQLDIYYNNLHQEIFECTVMDFFTLNSEQFPIQLQYFKNIKNKEFTKFQVLLRDVVTPYNTDYNYPIYDLHTPQTTLSKSFINLKYSDQHTIELLKADQTFSSNYYSPITTTNLSFYYKQSQDTVFYSNSWDYFDSTNSIDNISLNNLDFSTPSKGLVKESLITSSYTPKFTIEENICSNCKNNPTQNSLSVYKCNHNKNKDTITRNTSNVVASSNEHKDYIINILPWLLATSLSNIAINQGIPETDIYSIHKKICSNLNNSDYELEFNTDLLLANITNQLLSNSQPYKNLPNLFTTIKNEKIEVKTKNLTKQKIQSTVELDDVTTNIVIQNSIININAKAKLKKNIFLQKGSKYSLTYILHDEKSGITLPLLSNYLKYTGSNLDLTLSGQYNLENLTLEQKDAFLNNSISLISSIVLTKESSVIPVICSSTYKANTNNTNISSFKTSSNGFTCSFNPSIQDNQLQLTVNFVDSQKPQIETNKLEGDINFTKGSKVYDLLRAIKIIDNDIIDNLSIDNKGTKYTNFQDTLLNGETTITITDRTGNTEKLVYHIYLSD